MGNIGDLTNFLQIKTENAFNFSAEYRPFDMEFIFKGFSDTETNLRYG